MKFINILVAVVFLAGCAQSEKKVETEKKVEIEKKVEVNDVDYFLKHDDIRKSTLEDCKKRIKSSNDLETVMKEPNCKNADEAQKQYVQKFNSSDNTKRRDSVRAIPDSATR